MEWVAQNPTLGGAVIGGAAGIAFPMIARGAPKTGFFNQMYMMLALSDAVPSLIVGGALGYFRFGMPWSPLVVPAINAFLAAEGSSLANALDKATGI